ncbi:MAG: T9SS type A sorting domain-containing protein, partial [Ignavibacteriales bacterium]|nr:T9SS type A sorting domain-containing protein [Ignavibacteriales bacterium]
SGVCFESIRHTQIKMLNLPDYKAVIWMSGDQSILDSTITPSEQILLKGYLEQGGCLFISGSEIGWDLYNKGTASDKEFYTNYLKAIYVSDDAGSEIFQGISASLFDGLTGTFAQTYEVSFPDEIQAAGGSTIVMRYGNSKGAGIRYSGNFGSSLNPGRLVYLGFPLESTANDSVFNKTVKSVIQYFAVIVAVDTPGKNVPFQTNLEQNYPNPFNPSTVISYNLQESSKVKLEVFDALGRTITKLVDETQMPGEYRLLLKTADMHNPASGIYFYRLQVGQQYFSKKMILLQ